jgi:hypothetical protein
MGDLLISALLISSVETIVLLIKQLDPFFPNNIGVQFI